MFIPKRTIQLVAPMILSAAAFQTGLNAVEEPALRDVFKNDFLCGVAIGAYLPINSDSGKIVGKHFNRVTSENSMKWESMSPREGVFNYRGYDQLVEFIKKYDMKELHGHTCVWYQQTPNWLRADLKPDAEGKAKLTERLRTHINTVFSHCKEYCNVWDVANECIMADGSFRKSYWYEIMGPDYLKTVYDIAREALPEAKLVYNDFDTDLPAKRDGIVRMVNELNKDKKRVDMIGMQSHWRFNDPKMEEIERTLKAFASTGCKILISELDMDMLVRDPANPNPYPNGLPPLKHLEEREIYRNIFDLFLKYRDAIHAVTFWGVTDATSWLDGYPFYGRKNAPLLFDRQGKTKPAFWGVIDAAAMYGRDLNGLYTYQDGIAWETSTYSVAKIQDASVADISLKRLSSRILACAYSSKGDSGFKEIFCKFSYDDGETWENAPMKVASLQGKDCVLPKLGENPDGTILVSFKSADSTYVYSSSDEGLTWKNDDPNKRMLPYPEEIFGYLTINDIQLQENQFAKQLGYPQEKAPLLFSLSNGKIGISLLDKNYVVNHAGIDLQKANSKDFIPMQAKSGERIFSCKDTPRVYAVSLKDGTINVSRGLVMRENNTKK